MCRNFSHSNFYKDYLGENVLILSLPNPQETFALKFEKSFLRKNVMSRSWKARKCKNIQSNEGSLLHFKCVRVLTANGARTTRRNWFKQWIVKCLGSASVCSVMPKIAICISGACFALWFQVCLFRVFFRPSRIVILNFAQWSDLCMSLLNKTFTIERSHRLQTISN